MSYSRSWKDPLESGLVYPYSAWLYQPGDILQIGSVTCRHKTYPDGGYVVVIRKNRGRMLRLLQDLDHMKWLDNGTNAVLIQFTTFNPTSSLFTVALLAFEFTELGNVDPYYDINTYKLYNLTNMNDVNTMCYTICYLALLLLFMYRMCHSTWLAQKHNRKHIILNLVMDISWVIVVLTFACVFVFASRTVAINNTIKMARQYPHQHVSFARAAYLEFTLTCVLAAIIGIFVFKIIKIMGFRRQGLLITLAVKHIMLYVVCYVGVITVSVTSLSTVTKLIYGSSYFNYVKFSTSIVNTVKLFMFNSEVQTDVDTICLAFYGISLIVVTLFVPVGIVILVTTTARQTWKKPHLEDTDLFSFVFSRFLVMIGFWNMEQLRAHEDDKLFSSCSYSEKTPIVGNVKTRKNAIS